jgi:hypothetical protein
MSSEVKKYRDIIIKKECCNFEMYPKITSIAKKTEKYIIQKYLLFLYTKWFSFKRNYKYLVTVVERGTNLTECY